MFFYAFCIVDSHTIVLMRFWPGGVAVASSLLLSSLLFLYLLCSDSLYPGYNVNNLPTEHGRDARRSSSTLPKTAFSSSFFSALSIRHALHTYASLYSSVD